MKEFEQMSSPEEMDAHLLQEVKKMISVAKKAEKVNEARWVEIHAMSAPPMLIEVITKDYHEAKAGLAEQMIKLEEIKQQIKQRKEARNKAKEEGKK
jgi:hypothetical protein